ncbi:hypothetical protein K3163_04895 [Qipengyuania sp. 1NDW9]|uniref:hypothetical protein n=1 Tax=Qipengyuania xiapuensis TaxID=2867236 RepID=UPI001C86B8A9|nr:hypothetical protein [Qipengyuania xiapuensis]MBX7492541.1 hypothetical protein [Qipengyuania xiapuensis]
MNLPKIDLTSLPELDTVTGLFGSLSASEDPTVDDRVVVIMTYIYEVAPPAALL